MKSIAVFSIFGVLFFLVQTSALAADEPWTEQFMREFHDISARIERLEKQQDEILAKQDKILEEIARVRVWARR